MSSAVNNDRYSAPNLGPPHLEKSKEEIWNDANELTDICLGKGVEEGVSYLQDKWRREKLSPPAAFRSLVSSPLYLVVWSGFSSLNGSTAAIPEIPVRECVSITFSTCVSFLVLLDGATSYAGVQQYQHARELLKSAMNELAQSLAQGPEQDPWEKARIQAKCCELVKSALGLPGLLEVLTRFEADGLFSLNFFAQFVANTANTVDIHDTAKELAELFPENPDVLSIRSEADLTKFVMSLSPIQGKELTHTVPHLVAHQQENFVEQKTWALENLGFGLVTNVFSVGRSILELTRFSTTRSFLLERKEALLRALGKLNGKAGSQILTHLLDATGYKLKANVAAIVGGATRLVNAVVGIVIKSLTLASITTGPAAAVIAPIVLAIYAIKGFVGAVYERLAKRNECEVNNSFKIAMNDTSNNMANAINLEITADIEALAGDMERIKDFTDAMGRPELFEAFQKRYQSAATKKERLTELQALINACMPTSDALMNQQLIDSGDARMELIGHVNQSQADAAETSETAQPSPKTAPEAAKKKKKKKKKSGEVSLEQKFLRNPVDKAIASLTGTYPGWHRYRQAEEIIKKGAHAYLLKRQGDTEGVHKLLSIADALAANNELLRQYNPIQALIKGKTWQLSAKGQNLLQALESGDPQKLTARTLVAALTDDNHSVIASCRPGDTQDHAELCALLKEVRGVSTRPHLKTFVRALETCDGKQLLNVVQAMEKDRQLSPAAIQNTLKTALILSGLSHAQANQITEALLNPQSKASHTDVSQALAIALGQQLHARIADPSLRSSISGFLMAKQQTVDTQGNTLFVKTDGSDARWALYAKDLTTGKSTLAHTPDWLLSADVKKMLGHRPLGKNCNEALLEQFKISSIAWFAGQLRQPISLLWPSSVIKGLSDQTLRRSFIALMGMDPGEGASPQEMKRAARLYSSWTRTRPSLATLEAVVRLPNPGGRPPRLDARLALAWTLAPWGLQADAATVAALRSTKDSKGFIDNLVALVKDKQAKQKAATGTPVVRAQEIKPDSEHDELPNSSANDSTWMITLDARSIKEDLIWLGVEKDLQRKAMASHKNTRTIIPSFPGPARGHSVDELRGTSAPQRSPNSGKKTSFKKQPTSTDLSKHIQQHRRRASSMDLVVNPDHEYRLPDSSPLDRSFTLSRKHHPDFDDVRLHPTLATKKSA